MPSSSHHAPRLYLGLLLLSGACRGGEGPAGPESPGATQITVIAGASVTDTIQAKPIQALKVEVRRDGKLEPGRVVRFESISSGDTTRRSEQAVLVAKTSENVFSTFVSDTTEADGSAVALVQLGTIAGEARILVSCPELGLADTATFTVRPGNAVKLAINVRDTVVRAGGSYSLGASVVDRYNNRRQDPLTFTSASPLASVDATGNVVAGSAMGRGAIVVKAGSAVDSATFTVIPLLNLVFMHTRQNGETWIASGPSDLSSIRERVATASPAYPSASPTSDLIAFQRSDGSAYQIFVLDESGATRQLTTRPAFDAAYYPKVSSDGQYVYFSAAVSGVHGIWRVRTDGSGLTRLAVTDFGFTTPAVSPDGTRIAYSEWSGLMVLDVASGTKVRVGPSGWFAAFSPDGRRLAYLNGFELTVANADGSSSNPLPGYVSPDAGLSWLPGSDWVITRGQSSPILVNPATNDRVALTQLSNYFQIAVDP